MTDPDDTPDHRIPYRITDPTAAQRLKAAIKGAAGLRGIKQVRILAGPARGVTMTLDFSGHTPMYLGMYEWELHRFLHQVVKGASRAFDVGSSIGYDVLMLAANCEGEVVSFEPDSKIRPALLDNVAQNPKFADRITVSPMAVGREPASGVTTLDAVAEEFGAPDFIKLDIDGGEADALRGGLDLLRTRRPDLIVETHSLELERACGSMLVDCGYRPVIKHNRRIWREQRAGAPHNRWLLAAGKTTRMAAS